MDYGARAKENFQSGYSCAQAVFLACTEDMGLDTETGHASPRLLAAAWAACGRSAARSAGC